MKKLVLISLALFLIAPLSGCRDNVSAKISDLTKAHVKKVAIMYKMYSEANQFQGPKDEEELKTWVQDENRAATLARFGVDVSQFDSYLISDRTGDKLDIRWGVKSRPMAPPYPVVYEPNELDGTRHVGMAGGKTLEVDNDEYFEELKQGKYKPQPMEKL